MSPSPHQRNPLVGPGIHTITYLEGDEHMTVHGIDDLVVLDLPARPAWADDALCAQTDPETFFPEKGGTLRPAKRVCRACPVIAECLTWALDNNERFGVFGGKSAPERRKLIKARRDGAPARQDGAA